MRQLNLILLTSVILYSTTQQVQAAIIPGGPSPARPIKSADPKRYLTITIGSTEITPDQYTQILTCTETPARCILNFRNSPKGIIDSVEISQGPDYITATQLIIGDPNGQPARIAIENLLKIKLPESSLVITNYRAVINYMNIAAVSCLFQNVQFKSLTMTFKCSQTTQLKNAQL
jgi:hypothetical protein